MILILSLKDFKTKGVSSSEPSSTTIISSALSDCAKIDSIALFTSWGRLYTGMTTEINSFS
jgi:hypothetical protein